jgi:hypothetical protein
MEILRGIGDDDQYLGMRLKDLQTGYDYLDIVQYYEDKHNHELAVAYAEEGMEKGDGWANGLAEYLIGHYASKKDSESLARIMTACEQQLPRFRFEAAASIFAYFRSEGDYSSARKYLLKQADYAEGTFLKGIYDLMEGFLHEEDFAKAATGFLARLRQGNTTGYLEVLIKRGEYETALQAMKEAARPDYRWYGMQDYEHAAKTLEPHFPEALIEYYFSFMLYLVEAGAGKDRRNYKQAVFYLERAKSVYTDVLKDPVRWQNKLAEIREMFKTRRAFLEEARSVD